VAAKDGLDAKNFGTITRANGKKQTIGKGMPLYFFAGDKAPAIRTAMV
jgi:predicted lipoprotein with Yx(FWY)xxD motif